MPVQPHTAAWYDRLAPLQPGYYYPWRSRLGAWNGEAAHLALVQEHLHANADVLDVACGHGDVALDLAPRCRSLLGYDRVAPWIDRARHTAQERGIANATFLCHDSAPPASGGRARLPAADAAYDLLICRRGPFHWVEDARRVARPGAVLLMLVPNPTPATPWSAWLPAPLGWADPDEPLWARDMIAERLVPSGLAIDSCWSFVVPEIFPTPEELYRWRAWGYTAGEVALTRRSGRRSSASSRSMAARRGLPCRTAGSSGKPRSPAEFHLHTQRAETRQPHDARIVVRHVELWKTCYRVRMADSSERVAASLG